MRAHYCAMLSGLVSAVALFGVASCSTTVGTAPSQPAYDSDVRPILMAHCARCHGAGDALNAPTEPTGPDAAVLPSIANTVSAFNTLNIYLDRYSSDGAKLGAYASKGLIPGTLLSTAKPQIRMPPAPAPHLSDWEADVLTTWSTGSALCSNDPSPDSTICPNGPGPGP